MAYNLNFLEASIPYGSTRDQIVSVDAGRVAAKIGARKICVWANEVLDAIRKCVLDQVEQAEQQNPSPTVDAANS